MTGTSTNNRNGLNNPANVYFVSPNQYIVVDRVTGDLVQTSNLNKADWAVDSRIVIGPIAAQSELNNENEEKKP